MPNMSRGIKPICGFTKMKEDEYVPEGILPFFDRCMWSNSYQVYKKDCGGIQYFIIIADNASYWKTDGQQYATHLIKYGKGVKPRNEHDEFSSRGMVDSILMHVSAYVFMREGNERAQRQMKMAEDDSKAIGA